MKRLAIILTLLCGLAHAQGGMMPGPGVKGYSAGAAPSSFAYVASSVTGAYNTQASSQTITSNTLHQTPGAGHLLILGAWWGGATATMSCTDPNNGTWTAIGSPKTGSGALASYRGQMFYVASAVAGSTKVTCTISAGTTIGLGFEAAEYSYTGTISGFDGTPGYSNTAASGGTATLNGTTMGAALVTANASDLVWAACLGVTSACTAGSGYTGRNDTAACSNAGGGTSCSSTNNNYNSVVGALIEEKVNVAAGTQTATFGAGTTDAFIGGLVAF